jgi:hypothetical protein
VRIERSDLESEIHVYAWPRGTCKMFWEVADGKSIAMKREGKVCASGLCNG